MFSNRRPGKRSIIGTRVCAPNDDGFYYPGVIQAMTSSSSSSSASSSSGRQYQGDRQYYAVLFDNGTTKTFSDHHLIASGFQAFTADHVKPGQTVYITHNGREVTARVVNKEGRPLVDNDEILVSVFSNCSPAAGDEILVSVRLDDARLVESRKSARLVDQETEYIRLADLPPAAEGKKRTVSNVIDVPTPCPKLSRGNYSRSLDQNGMQYDGTSFAKSRDIETEIMDKHMAALVLTSLSCSPVSPIFPASLTDRAGTSPGQSFCNGSPGWNVTSGTSTPSPPQLILSQSAPAKVGAFTSFHFDERFDNGDVNNMNVEIAKRTVFRCTWPGCDEIYNTCPGIERHVRLEHLGPKEDGSVDDSDHEEEFYYTEVEVTLDAVVQTFADMCTSPAPPLPPPPPLQTILQLPPYQYQLPCDHDYQRKEFRSMPLTIPQSCKFANDCYGLNHNSAGKPIPVAVNSSAKTWHTNERVQPVAKSFDFGDLSPSPSMLQLGGTAASGPKSTSHRKSRNDVKKCRKVYGLENRSAWCTQCKWKKACTRFSDKNDVA